MNPNLKSELRNRLFINHLVHIEFIKLTSPQRKNELLFQYIKYQISPLCLNEKD